MTRRKIRSRTLAGAVALTSATLLAFGCSSGDGAGQAKTDSGVKDTAATTAADLTVPVAAAKLADTVSDRFQSFNLEMASVVGGTFWAPRGDASGQAVSVHPPVALDERLTNLTKALAPAYIRVSGSWANKVYFDDSDTPAVEAPEGFQSVLTAERWSEVGDFARSTGNKMVTSFAVGAGTRAADGSWTPNLAERFLRYTVDHDIPVEAAEFINEPNIQGTAGASYDANGFARDFRTLVGLRDQVDPDLLLLGPGGMVVSYEVMKPLDDPTTEELLQTSASMFDGFSFHSYTGMSDRCPTLPQVPVDRLMDRSVLGIMVDNIDKSRRLRDQFMPGKKIWLTETATAACGGDQTAPTFEGAFAYVEHLGDAARNGVWVHMYNTLVASDYGLLDDQTHLPRPSYWAAYLWGRLMGTRSLDLAPTTPEDKVSVFGHCLKGDDKGAVGVVISNRDGERSYTVDLGSKSASSITLTAAALTSGEVLANGQPLTVADDGTFSTPEPIRVDGRALTVAPHSISFITLPAAGAAACRAKG